LDTGLHEKLEELPSPHEAMARTELVADEGGAANIETGYVAVELASLRSVDELPGFTPPIEIGVRGTS
jgi:hypothetical protein